MKGTKNVLKKKKEESPGRWETQASEYRKRYCEVWKSENLL